MFKVMNIKKCLKPLNCLHRVNITKAKQHIEDLWDCNRKLNFN